MMAFGIIANVNGDRLIRNGAKVFIISTNGGGEAWQVRGLSLGGRMITKYVKLKFLSNFRAAFIPDKLHTCVRYETRENAEESIKLKVGA